MNQQALASVEDSPLRDQIIEAAKTSFRRYGVGKTTIEDIAREVGISRATVYRYVNGGREEIVLAVLIDESRQQLVALLDRHRSLDGLADTLTAIVTDVVVLNRENEDLAGLFNAESLGIGSAQPGAADQLLTGTLELFAPFFAAAREAGELRTDLTDREVAEYLLRITMSLLTFEGEAAGSRRGDRALHPELRDPRHHAPARVGGTQNSVWSRTCCCTAWYSALVVSGMSAITLPRSPSTVTFPCISAAVASSWPRVIFSKSS